VTSSQLAATKFSVEDLLMFKFLEGKTMAMKSTKNGCDGQSSAEHWDA